MTLCAEICKTSAVSSTLKPPKKRSSMTLAFRVHARQFVERLIQRQNLDRHLSRIEVKRCFRIVPCVTRLQKLQDRVLGRCAAQRVFGFWKLCLSVEGTTHQKADQDYDHLLSYRGSAVL
jgi:hypothetical protein